ncbi:mex-5 [Symbiodinium sp. CCMP2456]|nr:mex-5 [Symbiodinium sp. CCMP2456]
MKKTKMCEFHKEGRCKYGADCAFAHTESELQQAPDLRKTRLCRAFLQGKCDDSDCKFAHGEEELRASNICFKTALCTWFEKGNCQSGAQCRFAHGVEELRDDPDAKDPGLGGLYDFLPPPDPENDKATAAKARKAEQLSTRPKLPPVDRSRVIFLDVDGVLLPAGSVEMIFIDGVMLPVRAAKEADFNRTALSNLRAIVQQTGASIVLSSEWRRKEEMRDNIRRTLQTQDIPGIQDSTPIFQPSAELVKQRLDQAIIWAERRAREIGSWLKQHKDVKAWVAIDDIDFSWADSVKVSGTPLMKHRSVLTNPKYCITEKDAEEAVRILLNPPVIAPGEEADAIAAARYLTEEALAKCAGAGLM